MSDHTLTIDFDGGGISPDTTLQCHAPADADCHVVWDCDCEGFYDYRVQDGVPIHFPEYDTPTTVRDDGLAHRGRFDPEVCNLRDWHKNSDDDVQGSITVPVEASWEGDFYLFDVTPKPEDGVA